MVPKKEELLTSSDLRKAIHVEIRRIRSLVKEIASNYVSKVEGQAEDMAKAVEEIQIDARDEFKKMLKEIRELNVKPNKGRRKDLRRLEDLIDQLGTQIDGIREKQEKERKSGDAVIAAVKRGRGRPPKNAAASPVRRRGRPRKNPTPNDPDTDAGAPESSSQDVVAAAA